MGKSRIVVTLIKHNLFDCDRWANKRRKGKVDPIVGQMLENEVSWSRNCTTTEEMEKEEVFLEGRVRHYLQTGFRSDKVV